MGGYILAQDEQFTNLIVWKSCKKNLLYAYMENTLKGEISPKSVVPHQWCALFYRLLHSSTRHMVEGGERDT